MPYAHIRETTVGQDGRINVEGLPLKKGQRVQVLIIRQDPPASGAIPYPLHGQPLEYSDPFEPALPADDWEANR